MMEYTRPAFLALVKSLAGVGRNHRRCAGSRAERHGRELHPAPARAGASPANARRAVLRSGRDARRRGNRCARPHHGGRRSLIWSSPASTTARTWARTCSSPVPWERRCTRISAASPRSPSPCRCASGLRYRTAAAVARSLAEQILADTESYAGLLFNVTVPNLGLDKLQGVEITNLVPARRQL